MSENEVLYGTVLSVESIKAIAESIGIGNLPDEAAKELGDDVSYRLKLVIQVILVRFLVVFVNYFYLSYIQCKPII